MKVVDERRRIVEGGLTSVDLFLARQCPHLCKHEYGRLVDFYYDALPSLYVIDERQLSDIKRIVDVSIAASIIDAISSTASIDRIFTAASTIYNFMIGKIVELRDYNLTKPESSEVAKGWVGAKDVIDLIIDEISADDTNSISIQTDVKMEFDGKQYNMNIDFLTIKEDGSVNMLFFVPNPSRYKNVGSFLTSPYITACIYYIKQYGIRINKIFFVGRNMASFDRINIVTIGDVSSHLDFDLIRDVHIKHTQRVLDRQNNDEYLLTQCFTCPVYRLCNIPNSKTLEYFRIKK